MRNNELKDSIYKNRSYIIDCLNVSKREIKKMSRERQQEQEERFYSVSHWHSTRMCLKN